MRYKAIDGLLFLEIFIVKLQIAVGVIRLSMFNDNM